MPDRFVMQVTKNFWSLLPWYASFSLGVGEEVVVMEEVLEKFPLADLVIRVSGLSLTWWIRRQYYRHIAFLRTAMREGQSAFATRLSHPRRYRMSNEYCWSSSINRPVAESSPRSYRRA